MGINMLQPKMAVMLYDFSTKGSYFLADFMQYNWIKIRVSDARRNTRFATH